MQALPQVSPGVYPGSGQASLLKANGQQWLFQQQLIVAGQSSIAVQLERIKMPYFYPFAASLQVFFTNAAGAPASPGAFELDWQDSDLDADIQYVTMASYTLVGTASLNASFVGRIEATQIWTKFMRVNLKTMPNSGVYTSALVTR
jgi:hypothetical protein